jgi:VanZ family protein
MGMIFFLSSQSKLPGPSEPWFDFIFKKSAHITVYAFLCATFYRAWAISWPTSSKVWLVSLLLTLSYALSDELHQSFVPGRYPAVSDVGFDLIGAFLSLYMVRKNSKPATK